MINIKTVAMIAVGLAVSAATSQAAIEIGTFGPAIEFNSPNDNTASPSFTFPTPGMQWFIGTSTGNIGQSYGFLGTFGNTVFTFDNAGNISGSGTLTIKDKTYFDLSGYDPKVLTGNFTFGGQLAVDGAGNASINKTQQINVTGITYVNGTNPDLMALAASGQAVLSISISRALTPLSMASLAKDHYILPTSATIAAVPVPEPSTYLAGLGALALFGFTAMPRRKQVK